MSENPATYIWFRVCIAAVTASASFLVALPTIKVRENVLPALFLANVAAWAACLLALALVYRLPENGPARFLAVFLASAALAWGCLSATAVSLSPIEQFRHGIGILSIFPAMFGLLLFATSFPRCLTKQELARFKSVDTNPMADGSPILQRTLGRVFKLEWFRRFRGRIESKGTYTAYQSWLYGVAPQGRWSLRGREGLVIAVVSLAYVLIASLLMGSLRTAMALGIAYYIFVTAFLSLIRFGFKFEFGQDMNKRKLLWVLEAFILLFMVPLFTVFITGVITIVSGSSVDARLLGIIPIGAAIGALAFIVCLAVAIFKDGTLDPALAIRKTAAYGGLSIILISLFAALEYVIANFIASHLGLAQNGTTLIAGGCVALAFGPLRLRSDKFVNRALADILPATALSEELKSRAVIVFSDIVGYTALSATDDKTALTVASAFHKTARRSAAKHQGHVVKTIGDAVLMEFTSANDALSVAANLSNALQAACELLEVDCPQLRTGIHAGTIARDIDGDVFGDAVNIASRLQTAATPGEIIVSTAIATSQDILAQYKFESLGERALKNVPGKVMLFRLIG